MPVGPGGVGARVQALPLNPESHRPGAALLALAVRTLSSLAVPSLTVRAFPSNEFYAFASQAIHLDLVHFVRADLLQSVGIPEASKSVVLICHAVSHPNAGFIFAQWG